MINHQLELELRELESWTQASDLEMVPMSFFSLESKHNRVMSKWLDAGLLMPQREIRFRLPTLVNYYGGLGR